MTVEELIAELLKVENKKANVIISYVNSTWSGGCDTCGHGAIENREEKQTEVKSVYDFSSRIVIEGICDNS